MYFVVKLRRGPMEMQHCPLLLQPVPPHTALSDSVHTIPVYMSRNCMRPVIQSDTNHLTHAYSVHTPRLYWYGELTTIITQETRNVRTT